MNKIPVFLMVLLVNFSYSQITVISTGTSENLYKISGIGENFLISGVKNYLGKCYVESDSLFPLNVPSFPNSNYFFTVERPDTNVLYITAFSSANLNLTFWKSRDGGYNWVKKFDTVNPSMYEAATIFFDSLIGISFSANYKSIKTFDGFKTYSFGAWNSWNFGGTAHLCGDSTILVSQYNGFSVSKDRGITWPYGQGLGTNNVHGFGCFNKDTLFCLSGGNYPAHLLSSFDGGQTWISNGVNGNTYNIKYSEEVPNGLCPKNKVEIYLPAWNSNSGFGVILKTSDLGKTWSKFVTPFKKHLYDMKFINDSAALVCGEGGLLFKWNSKRTVFTGLFEDIISDHSVSVYPNPISDKLYIEFKGIPTEKIQLTLINFYGQTVYSASKLNKKQEWDVSFLPKGIYFLKVWDDSGQKVYKISKE